MEYFKWLRVKNSNYLYAEFSLCYLGDAKFYLESKASFIDISNAILRNYLKLDCLVDTGIGILNRSQRTS